MTIELIKGDLLTCDAQFIAHQTNCISVRSAHLAKAIFDKFPYSDVYSKRDPDYPDAPGTIKVMGNGKDQRFVINMFGQFYPGSPKFPDNAKDGYKARQKYFFQCLYAISKIKNLESIAFPFCVGCAAAGGDWEIYNNILEKFSVFVGDKVKVSIIVKEEK